MAADILAHDVADEIDSMRFLASSNAVPFIVGGVLREARNHALATDCQR